MCFLRTLQMKTVLRYVYSNCLFYNTNCLVVYYQSLPSLSSTPIKNLDIKISCPYVCHTQKIFSPLSNDRVQ